MANLIGRDLGRFHVVEQLGEGGMASVYKAYDVRLERDVAVKIIRIDQFAPAMLEQMLKRFEREAKALARLTHPNIVHVNDYGEENGIPYLVMDFLPGKTLKERLGKPMPWQAAVRLLLPVTHALEYAHLHNILHRDIKPSNILLTESGQPMLSDFGIAKILESEEFATLTGTGVGIGTPEYMAPEQWTGQAGFLSDLYSLGVVFYELVTGRKPFTADTPAAILLKQASEPLPRPTQFAPDLPEAVEKVLFKALAKNPEDRYQGMRLFSAALENLLVGQPAPEVLPEEATRPPVASTPALHAVMPPPSGQPAGPEPASLNAAYPAPVALDERTMQAGMTGLEQRSAPPPQVPPAPPAPPSAGQPVPASRGPRWKSWRIAGIIIAVLLVAGAAILFFSRMGKPAALASTPTALPTETVVVPLLLPTATLGFVPPDTPVPIPPTPTIPYVIPTEPAHSGPVEIRWSVGIGTGSEATQVPVENQVVFDFNQSQNKIHLNLEVIPNASARNTLAREFASGTAPDIIGPVGWLGSNAFSDQWLDLAPYMQLTHYDTSKFEPALAKMYQTDQGTVGLPFAVYPSAIYYNTDLFSKAGLNPPPAKYGDQYKMPDGTLVDWNWETLAKVARLLTLDATGKNPSQPGFNKFRIVQYGFSFGWEAHPNYWATYMSNGGRILAPGGSEGGYAARLPDGWKAAWQWLYDGIWGDLPFIPSGPIAGNAIFAKGNVFASGKVAMIDGPSWYLCCVNDSNGIKPKFDFGAMPIGLDGQVAGRVDADTFRIWKGTKYPVEAFAVVAYLVDTGINKLVVGTPGQAPAYGALPGQTNLRGPWLASQKANYPFVKNWDVLIAGLNYPDVPSAEGYMPNITESWARLQNFGDVITSSGGLNLAGPESVLESDLNAIFNK